MVSSPRSWLYKEASCDFDPWRTRLEAHGEEAAGGGGGSEASSGEAAMQQGEGLQIQEELLQQGGGRHLLRHPPLSLCRLCSSLPRSIHPLPLTSFLRQLHVLE